MTLYTACIFKKPLPEDGLRISVMSRHTLNDGKTPDTRITRETYHHWMQSLAPPSKLVEAWYRVRTQWNNFEQEYFNHLHQDDITIIVKALAQQALTQDITLLCVEETPEQCHRRLLAEECKRYQPNITIIHR